MNIKKKFVKRNGSSLAWTIVLLALCIGIVFGSLWFVFFSISKGVSLSVASFQESYNEARSNTYTKYHDLAYKISESENHVSNKVTISIREVKEKSNLDVLKVNDVVYIISEGEEKGSDTTSWLKVYGSGVFTVNLMAAEFIVDNERQHVLVRVPRPGLESNNISIDDFEKLYFKENVRSKDNSVKSGEELARNMLSEAKQRIQEDFEANEQYFKLAEKSTIAMLSALIEGINPEVEGLQVEVEFY